MDNLFRGIGVSFRDCKRLTIPMGYALRRSRLLVWSGQLCRGMSGNFAWNRRQLCGGISGSFYAESVATFGWNRWQLSRGIRTMIEEPNRPDVAGADPSLPQLIRSGAHGIIPCINRLTGRQEGKMPVARRAVIGEGIQAGVAREVGGLQGDGTAGRVTN